MILNSPEVLREKLREAGINKIQFYPDPHLPNGGDTVFVILSYQALDRLQRSLEPLMKFTEREIKE
jgi:hypothetical protein